MGRVRRFSMVEPEDHEPAEPASAAERDDRGQPARRRQLPRWSAVFR